MGCGPFLCFLGGAVPLEPCCPPPFPPSLPLFLSHPLRWLSQTLASTIPPAVERATLSREVPRERERERERKRTPRRPVRDEPRTCGCLPIFSLHHFTHKKSPWLLSFLTAAFLSSRNTFFLSPQELQQEGDPVLVIGLDGFVHFNVGGWLPSFSQGSQVRKEEVEICLCTSK